MLPSGVPSAEQSACVQTPVSSACLPSSASTPSPSAHDVPQSGPVEFGELVQLLSQAHEEVLGKLASARREIVALGGGLGSPPAPLSSFAGVRGDDCVAVGTDAPHEKHEAHPRLNSMWQLTDEKLIQLKQQLSTLSASGKVNSSRPSLTRSPTLKYNKCVSRFVMRPNSPPTLAWDIVGALLIFYDLMSIPMGVFKPPKTKFTSGVELFTMIFWTLNCPFSLLIGFFDKGTLVLVPRKIAQNYVRGWFVVDLATVIPDWIFYLVGDVSGDFVGLLRIVRLIKIGRLSRAMKLRKLVDAVNDFVNSEKVSIMGSIAQMIVLLLIVNHFVACLWFAVSNSQEGKSWIDNYGYREVDWGHQYAVAFHWSITQFTPSSMHVQPQNVPERITSICVVVFALVGFSYIVGSISGSLAQLRNMKADAAKQFWHVRKYLKKQQVPTELATRVKQHLEYAFERQEKNSSVKEVKMFSLLSSGLLSELHCHNYLNRIAYHPLFWYLGRISKVTAHRLASAAVEERYYAEGDVMFHATEQATHMWFMGGGLIRYEQRMTAPENKPSILEIDPHIDAWISEPALWIESWMNVGTLTAVMHCNMILLVPNSFYDVMRLNPEAYALALTYAKNFMRWRSDGGRPVSDVVLGTDLHNTFQGFLEMPRDGRDSRRLEQCSAASWSLSGALHRIEALVHEEHSHH